MGSAIDLSDPCTFWVSNFDEQPTKEFCTSVMKYSLIAPNRPIIVYINTPGGRADGLMTMIAVLDSVPNQLITVALGQAHSAGAILLSHGDVRFVSPVSRVMIHQIQGGAVGCIDDIENEFLEMN